MKKLLLVMSVVLVGFVSCYKDNAEDMYPAGSSGGGCDTTNTGFSTVIQPIINAKCATSGCHLGSAATGYDLSDYHGVAAVANSGKLLNAINHTGGQPMPKDQPKLDNCTIAKITKWVNNGAQDN
jgi:hypothetical protein